jgi:hypothetical protein
VIHHSGHARSPPGSTVLSATHFIAMRLYRFPGYSSDAIASEHG